MTHTTKPAQVKPNREKSSRKPAVKPEKCEACRRRPRYYDRDFNDFWRFCYACAESRIIAQVQAGHIQPVPPPHPPSNPNYLRGRRAVAKF